jgi:MFS family permease
VSTTIPDRNIWLIYAAILVLGLAYGISLALTALQLDAVGFGKHEIGTLATIFASGIVLLSLPMGRVIGALSAKTTLVACLLVYAACVSAFPYQTQYASVGALRFFDGASSVGIWVACETILLSRAAPERKALVMSLYAMAMALGYLGGAVIAKGIYAATGSMTDAFLTSGAIAVLSALLVMLRLERDAPVRAPVAPAEAASHTTAGAILLRIKTSCFAAFSYGYFQASVVLFLPLFLIEQKGIPKAYTILVPAIFSLGMLLFTSYAGRLGDRFGQLRVMRLLAAVGTLMILGFVLLSSWTPMCIAIFVAGASLASISPLSLALQGRSVEPRDYGRATALYNTFYALGMLIGPPISSFFFERRGGEAMLIHLALLWASFVLFALWFAKDDPAAVSGEARADGALRLL